MYVFNALANVQINHFNNLYVIDSKVSIDLAILRWENKIFNLKPRLKLSTTLSHNAV